MADTGKCAFVTCGKKFTKNAWQQAKMYCSGQCRDNEYRMNKHKLSCPGCEVCSGGDENLQEYNDPLKS